MALGIYLLPADKALEIGDLFVIMSRIGKQPVILPQGVKVVAESGVVHVESKRGKLSLRIPSAIAVEIENDKVTVTRKAEDKITRSLHGTIRALLANMVKGAKEGFLRELEIVGVGYKAQMKADNLVLNIGLSHPVELPVPSGLKVSTPKANRIIIEGIDKQKVGKFASQIRSLYPPEPYKGKGIRYLGEVVRKKLGKALAK